MALGQRWEGVSYRKLTQSHLYQEAPTSEVFPRLPHKAHRTIRCIHPPLPVPRHSRHRSKHTGICVWFARGRRIARRAALGFPRPCQEGVWPWPRRRDEMLHTALGQTPSCDCQRNSPSPESISYLQSQQLATTPRMSIPYWCNQRTYPHTN